MIAKKWNAAVFSGAVLTILSASAHAQSKVALYGILDEGIVFQSNTGGAAGGKKVSLDSLAGNQGSRWGLTGVEDLGGGNSAIFTIESGVNLNTGAFGQGGTPFGRQAFVGLSNSDLGSVTLGRQYDTIIYFVSPLTSAWQGTTFGHPGDLDNTLGSVRWNNAIRYTSPTFRGFAFGALYGVGGVPGNVTGNSGYSVGASYQGGALSAAAAFEYFKNPTSSTPGSGFFTNNASGASLLAFSLNSAYASASAYQVAIAGVGYNIGPVLLTSSFSNVQYANLGPKFSNGTARFNNVDATIKYTYSSALFFSLAYNYLIGKGVQTSGGETVGNQHYNQVAAMADYFLSKRTDTYVTVTYQRASGTSSTGAPAVANIVNQGDSSNNHQFLIRLALRHKF